MNNYSNQSPENGQNQEAQQMGQFLHNQHKRRKNKKKKKAQKVAKALKKSKTKKAMAGAAKAGTFILANLPLIGWILLGAAGLIVLLIILIILLDNVNPCKKSSSSGSDSGGPETTTKSYKATAKAMWAECKHLGLSDNEAAGICGQSNQEDTDLSLDRPSGDGLGGVGLFQVTPGSKLYDYCNKTHKNWKTPQAQVDYMVKVQMAACPAIPQPWVKKAQHESVAQTAMDAAKAEGGSGLMDDSNEGNRHSGASMFYKWYHGQDSSDADSTASSGSDSSCGQSVSSDSADGTGSVKEKPFAMWKPSQVPSDVKPYIHDPRDVGMEWEGPRGWEYPGNQCADFAPSYFVKIWGIKGGPHPQGNGNQCAQFMKDYLKSGTLSKTPHAGDIASSNNSHMTNCSAGHTWIVEHVLKNGDTIIAEENYLISGQGNGTRDDWNFQLLPKGLSQTEYYHPSGKYHLNWGK